VRNIGTPATFPTRIAAAAVVVAVAALTAGCGSSDEPTAASANGTTAQTVSSAGVRLPQGAEPVKLDPRDFTTRIDNPWSPMTPGSQWVYTDSEGGDASRVTITVTDRTQVVAGVTARVVHDIATRGKQVIEDTFDWFAQDRAGNVWYLGEATTAYDNGKPSSTKGSWEAGVAGAQAGIAVPANPTAGLRYRQEYRKGRAEDAAAVLSVDEQVESPYGHFTHALLTKEFTPIEPKALEYKLYAKGVGLVVAVGVSGDNAREELVSYRKGSG
jgi:hypothetical protein